MTLLSTQLSRCLNMRAIIDADPLAYMVGFGHDNMPLWYQCQMLDRFIEDVLEATLSADMVFYLTGKGNFRDEVATILPYKGQRDSTHRPRFHKELRDYMVNVWDAILIEGMEADDACGIDAYQCRNNGTDYTICTIDKDLDMLEGLHYNYKRRELYEVQEVEAWRFFYTQMLTGDPSDNIPGLFKIAGVKASKRIKEGLLQLSDPAQMETYVTQKYMEAGADVRCLYEIGTLLWMRRKPLGEEDEWPLNHISPTTT